jgi:hypothetical protein
MLLPGAAPEEEETDEEGRQQQQQGAQPSEPPAARARVGGGSADKAADDCGDTGDGPAPSPRGEGSSGGGSGPSSTGGAGAAATAPSASSSGDERPPDAAAHHRPAASDPDYEAPRGALTETAVYNRVVAAAGAQHFDRYGFRDVGADTSAGLGSEPAGASGAGGGTGGGGGGGKEGGEADEWLALRRAAKWARMVGPRGERLAVGRLKGRDAARLKARCRKGVPPEFRGLVWHCLSGGVRGWGVGGGEGRLGGEPPARSGGSSRGAWGGSCGRCTLTCTRVSTRKQTRPLRISLSAHPAGGRALQDASPAGTYAQLQGSCPPEHDAPIMRDLNRTYPTNVYFMERQVGW